jgi:hypothetical protein
MNKEYRLNEYALQIVFKGSPPLKINKDGEIKRKTVWEKSDWTWAPSLLRYPVIMM